MLSLHLRVVVHRCFQKQYQQLSAIPNQSFYESPRPYRRGVISVEQRGCSSHIVLTLLSYISTNSLFVYTLLPRLYDTEFDRPYELTSLIAFIHYSTMWDLLSSPPLQAWCSRLNKSEIIVRGVVVSLRALKFGGTI